MGSGAGMGGVSIVVTEPQLGGQNHMVLGSQKAGSVVPEVSGKDKLLCWEVLPSRARCNLWAP